jgi:hypothetical protein
MIETASSPHFMTRSQREEETKKNKKRRMRSDPPPPNLQHMIAAST